MPENYEWKVVASGTDTVDWAGSRLDVDRTGILGRDLRLEVFDHYWIGGRTTTNAYVGKALQAWSRLVDADDDAALIVLYTPSRGPGDDEAARQTLRSFAAAMSPTIERSLDGARRSGR